MIFYMTNTYIYLCTLVAVCDVLIVPKRTVLRYSELSICEVKDLTESATRVSKVLEVEYPEMRNGSIWLIQDGKDAGQTISHVHLHIIPQRFSEWCKDGVEDVNRLSRTKDEMKKEAEYLKIKLCGGGGVA